MLPSGFIDPDKSLSLTPFWFWNDALEIPRLLRQMDDFQKKGIYGFVIHPRLGLKRDFAWMSPNLLNCMRVVIKEAHSRGMHVILYDEAMYPSGSGGGQVVAHNPAFACRGLVMQSEPPVEPGHHLVYSAKRSSGEDLYIVDRPLDSAIRGVHFQDGYGDAQGEGSTWMERRLPEDRPAATDLLNPDAVACFIQLVYQRYYDEFGEYFGNTIPAIFTDEPWVMGRFSPYNCKPGTTGILEHVSAFLGYDFTPYLPALWLDDLPDYQQHRNDYRRAIYRRLEDTYYRQLGQWCDAHGVALTGHPERTEDIGHSRHFQWPGQDVIFGDILPGEKSIAGEASVQAKCAASAAIHLNRKRNANEFMGAYGESVSLDTYRFVANWLLVRGCNLLIPHAYFYSVRGARIDDCPPQLGPHGAFWQMPELVDFHKSSHRLSWLNFESMPLCEIAVLSHSDRLPEESARCLFENQYDFHYLEDRHLLEDAILSKDSIQVGPMTYRILIVEEGYLTESLVMVLEDFMQAGRVILYKEANTLLKQLAPLIHPLISTSQPCPWLRARVVQKQGALWCMLLNEGTMEQQADIAFKIGSSWYEISPVSPTQTVKETKHNRTELKLASGEIKLFYSPE